MPSRFVWEPTFLRAFERRPEVRLEIERQAGHAASKVEAVAPRDTGDYAESIETFSDGRTVGVTSTDFAAHIIEWGSVNNPPFAPLRRGVQAAGFRLRGG